MVRSEDAQLACMPGFLKANGLAEKLLNKDWTGFARLYNGPSYWQNRRIKLANIFRFVIAIILFFGVASSMAIPARGSKRRYRAG